MQETPVQQAPTRRRAAKPMHHNYRAMALASSLWAANPKAPVPRVHAPQEKPTKWETCALQLRIASAHPTRESQYKAMKTQHGQK